MATTPLGPGDISLRDFIEAIGSADAAHGAVSTAAVAGGLGSSLLLMVAALPQTRSDLVGDRAKAGGGCGFVGGHPTAID
jgi:hypothetical protein